MLYSFPFPSLSSFTAIHWLFYLFNVPVLFFCILSCSLLLFLLSAIISFFFCSCVINFNLPCFFLIPSHPHVVSHYHHHLVFHISWLTSFFLHLFLPSSPCYLILALLPCLSIIVTMASSPTLSLITITCLVIHIS